MEMRRATFEDAASLSALNVTVQRLHAQALPDLFKSPKNEDFALDFMQDQLSNPENYIYIANLDGIDIGYIFIRLIDRPENAFTYAWKYLYIDQISVIPAYHGRGFGGKLLEKAKELANHLGVRTVALDTWSFNQKAQAFFTRQGFVTFNFRMWNQENTR